MSILSVDTIQPIGSGSTVTLNAAKIVVGTGITFESNGQAIYAGIITATSFSGSGANLTSLPAANLTGTLPAISGANLTNLPDSDSITEGNSYAEILDTGTNGIFRFVPEGSEVFRITHDGKMGLNETNPTRDVVFKNAGGNCQVSITAGTSNSAYLNLGDTDDDNIGSIYYSNSDNRIVFRVNTTDTVRMESDGNIRILDGNLKIATAGHGIDFSAAGNAGGMTSELLDDYEEGSWTPVMQWYTSGAFQNVTMTTAGTIQQPRYTKVGRWVTATMNWTGFQISGSTLAYARLAGLPFTSTAYGAAVVSYNYCFSGVQDQGGWLANGQTSVDFYRNGNSWNNWISASGTYLQLSCHYQAS